MTVRNEFSGSADTVIQARSVTYEHHEHAPADRGIPHEVPPCTPHFVNRTVELAEMDSWFAEGEGGPPRIAVLSGLPGVGKSTTVRRWAEQARGRYPGGEIHVDFAELRGEPGGADVAGGLARCLRALGVADRHLPATLAELSGLYRTRTAGRSLLVVLDDVTHPAHVSALVPAAPGSAVLVTSSRRLGELVLDGAHLMPLEPLGADSGRELFVRLCGEERLRGEAEAVDRLVQHCGGLPVALHIAAARLVQHRRLTPAALDAELAEESGRMAALSIGSGAGRHSVTALLSVVLRDLPADAARLHRRLGLLPVRTFDAGTAAAADGRDPASVQDVLDVLDTASLLETTEDGRHRLHGLVQLHARATAEADEPTEEREAVVRRVVDHYVTRAAFADRAVMGSRLRITDHGVLLADRPDPFTGSGARDAALAWLETERADALATLRAAAAHGLDRQAWQLAESLTALYFHHRHLTDWIESGTLGADAAARTGDGAAEARLRSLLSRPLMDVGAADRARREIDRAVGLADASGHPVLRASVREFAGRYWDHVDPDRAVQEYEHCLALNIDAREWRGAALARYFMGCTQDASGDSERALATLSEAYEQLVELGDARMAGRALAAVGRAHDRLGREAEALAVLERAVQMLREQQAVYYEAQVSEELAGIAARQGDRAGLRRYLTRALEIHEADGSPRTGELRERLEGLGD